ncbi:hypothetical protein Sjap_008685 [Stephania japonica]|uniref:Uncharacterized protein n=1 Tax=Stephania japonica TaxID=461633 RepID=A0AAP0JQQ2_9MAGN
MKKFRQTTSKKHVQSALRRLPLETPFVISHAYTNSTKISLLSPVEEVDRNGEALSHLKEVGGWRSTRNRSKIMPSMLSNELGNLSRGKGNDSRLLHKNRVGTNGSVFDDSEVTVLWSSHDVSDMGCPRSSDNHGHDIPASVIDINELSPEVLVRSHNSHQMANDDSNNRTKQIDANIAWALQREENAWRASLNRRLHVDSRESSMEHLYRQYPSQYLNNSLVRSANCANRSRGRTSRRMAQPRNGFHDQYTDLPSFEKIQFPPTMDVDTRIHILEALEAAVSDGAGLARASNIFQFQRDFNENDYEMLSALDEHNPPCDASLNQINGLPQFVVQTDKFDKACAICLETPNVGDTIRHLACLHKFHKDTKRSKREEEEVPLFIIFIISFTRRNSHAKTGLDNTSILQCCRLCIVVCVVRLSAALAFGTFLTRPDDSLCANGGRDGVTLLWDLAEGKKLYSLDARAIINAEGGIGCAQRRKKVSRFGT